MHARTRARFGHDEKGRLLKKRANILAYSQRLVPTLQRRQVGRAKETEPGLKYRRENILPGENVIPSAEKSEIVAGDPFEKLNGLGNLLGCKWRRCGLQL